VAASAATGLGRVGALVAAGLAVLIYLLGFTDGVSTLISALPGAMLVGGGLLAAVSVLPRTRWLLAPAVVVAVVGALQVLQKTATTSSRRSARPPSSPSY